MPELRKELPALPERMKRLPVDERGYPCPWFIHWQDGKPEFRMIGVGKWQQAYEEGLCWVCGEAFTNRRRAFVVGPMCTVNRVSAEPPCHVECARFSAMACPFLTKPHMVRRENDLPADRFEQEGHAPENPGVMAVWHTRSWEPLKTKTGYVARMGEPTDVEWFAQGRMATRKECYDALSRRIPLLIESYKKEHGEPGVLACGEHVAWVTQNIFPKERLTA